MIATFAKHRTLNQGRAKGMEVATVPDDVDEKDEESSDVMNVLFAGDNRGSFRLRLFGGFEVKAVSLLNLMESYGVKSYKVCRG